MALCSSHFPPQTISNVLLSYADIISKLFANYVTMEKVVSSWRHEPLWVSTEESVGSVSSKINISFQYNWAHLLDLYLIFMFFCQHCFFESCTNRRLMHFQFQNVIAHSEFSSQNICCLVLSPASWLTTSSSWEFSWRRCSKPWVEKMWVILLFRPHVTTNPQLVLFTT